MHFPFEQVNLSVEQSENVRTCSDPAGKLQMPLSPFVDWKHITGYIIYVLITNNKKDNTCTVHVSLPNG